MSLRKPTTGTSLREYAAAEDRLLDFFSPATNTENATATVTEESTAVVALAYSAISDAGQNSEVDPSKDNMLPFISDDTELHSLLSNSDSSFKGFNDEMQEENKNGGGGVQTFTYGVFRNAENISRDHFMVGTTSKHNITNAPVPVDSPSDDYMLTNGIDPRQSNEDEIGIEIEDQHELHADCVIYDDNVVLLTDDQCCEIIVHADQEMERAYLIGMQPVAVEEQEQQQQRQQQLDNGVSYNVRENKDEVEPTGEPYVYLSDAAMVLEQQQHLLLEETPQVSDTFVGDICEVFDNEQEEHDDECVVDEPQSSLQMQLQDMDVEQHEPKEQPTTTIIASDVEEQQQELAAAAVIPHSSTTEFPVSSTSMPNASDYDDYDADVGTAEEHSPPHPRKYALLKNTLSAEAMDRRLANICQSQPQMSVSEKFANWNCARNCDVVEDVENFEAEFEQHDANPAVPQKFNEFYDKLRQSMAELKRNLMQRNVSIDVHDTLGNSREDVAFWKRPNYRRLQESEPILLDDDDDDDCIEIQVTPSVKTLVPESEPDPGPESKHNKPENVVAKTTETQTMSQALQSKETSTTDLSNHICMPPPPPASEKCLKLTPIVSEAMLYDVNVYELEEQQRPLAEHQQRHEVLGNSLEYHKNTQVYEQHEFCQYLGLTELATANAVSNAMRELAKSTVARRSLRVRTQQQLDRMRRDVRGKRRQKEKRDPQEQKQDEKPLTSESNSSVEHHSNCSSNPKSLKMTGKEVTLEEVVTTKMPLPRISPPAPTIEYYYHSPSGKVQHHPNALLTVKEANSLSLPAHNDLHESIQNRLRQARETKPSIYIVKSLNNSVPNISTSAVSPTQLTPSTKPLKYNNTPEPIDVAPKMSGKVNKKTPQKTTTRRRRTTAGGTIVASIPPDRELITRSMNSKMLRNRKVNMLKTFELADVAQSRNKLRLSGGSVAAGKRTTSKTAKRALRKPKTPSPLYQPVDDSQQHRLELQQKQQNQQCPSKSKSPKTSRTPNRTTTNPKLIELTKRKRFRAKSLPITFHLDELQRVAFGDVNGEPVTPEMSQMHQLHLPKPSMDTHGLITKQALVSPPLYSEVRTPKKQLQQQPLAEKEKLSPRLEEICDVIGPHAQLTKPTLIYPPLSPPTSQRTPQFSWRKRQMAGSNLIPKVDKVPQVPMTPPGGLLCLTQVSTTLRNPLAGKNGKVLYMYYELEQLIVLQERVISFWKYSKIFNVLQKAKPDESSNNATVTQKHPFNIFGANTIGISGESDRTDPGGIEQSWVYLGGTRRTTNDMEVIMPFVNRMCANNSTPVYIEMRSHQLDHHRREKKLLSLYVNVYYYCEEELRPKMHSVHLDAVNCERDQVLYTSISESRYFVMAWQQEIVMGKPRAGICKYSLTPTLDTLASIREFKQLRHELKHIECLTEDRLIGYGQTRITIWDHRSGDTLMNYDLGFKLGRNLGVIHFPSFEMDQSSLLILYQHVQNQNKRPELRIIACELSHTTPSHRLLHVHRLPSPQFDCQLIAINTGDHLILKTPTDDEIWISITDPRQLTYLAPQGTQRFYTRQKSQVIIVTPETLTVDSIANHVLQLATQHQQKMMLESAEVADSTG